MISPNEPEELPSTQNEAGAEDSLEPGPLWRRRPALVVFLACVILLDLFYGDGGATAFLVICGLAIWIVRRLRRERSPEASAGPWPRARTYVLAGGLLLFDGVIGGQGVFSLLMLVIAVPGLVLLALLRWKDAARRKRRFLAGAIYAAAAGAAMALIQEDTKGARARAQQVIAACREYQRTNGKYPPDLQSLAPRHLSAVPQARRRIFGNRQFNYVFQGTNATLIYVSFPPYGRTTYDFETGKWGFYD